MTKPFKNEPHSYVVRVYRRTARWFAGCVKDVRTGRVQRFRSATELWTFVVGAPFGITHTLTVGHLSARRKSNTTSSGMAATELFQTDTAINRGNSGGRCST